MTTRTIPTMTVGDRIRLARRHAGLTAAQLAAGSAIDPNTVSNYENGKTTPPATKLRRIAELTGVDEAWLATGVPSDQAIPGSPWHPADLEHFMSCAA